MKNIFLFAFLLSLILLAGCSGVDQLVDTGWVLKSLNGQPILTDTEITLNFTGGKAAGSDGCNHINGSYHSGGKKLSFSNDFMSTMMACSEPVMTQAAEYVSVLTQVKSFKLEGELLTIYDKTGAELAVFKKLNTSVLAGTSWSVTGFNKGGAPVSSLIAGTDMKLSFLADSKLDGSSGCNHYTASYEVSSEKLTIGQLAATKTMCLEPSGVMEQEAAYLKALGTVSTFRLDGERLDLLSTDGSIAVYLQKSQ